MGYKTDNKHQIKHDKARKKEFNYHGDFYPGSLWEYPYPYFHPMYGCGAPLECPDCDISKQGKCQAVNNFVLFFLPDFLLLGSHG